jgi:hypothetical protein
MFPPGRSLSAAALSCPVSLVIARKIEWEAYGEQKAEKHTDNERNEAGRIHDRLLPKV